MNLIPYEENSFYIFDRGYNDFKRLHNIESFGAYFVIRGKKNNDFKPENAVRNQIYSAITAYCMMAIVQKKLGIKRSINEMLQIASISLTDTTDLNTLFGKSNYNIVSELNGSNEPTLF